MRISENMSVASAVIPAVHTTVAIASDIVSMKQYGALTAIIQVGDIGSGATAMDVTVSQCTAVAGTAAKSLGIDYVYVGSSTDDTLLKTTVTSDTFEAAELGTYVIEISDQELDVANGFDCVRVNISAPGSQGAAVSVILLSSEARTTVKTALTD